MTDRWSRGRVRIACACLVAFAVVGPLTACGLGPDQATPIDALPGSSPVTTTGGPTSARPALERSEVWLVKDDTLVPVPRVLPANPSVRQVLVALELPLTTVELERGLRSVVGPADPSSPLVLPADKQPSKDVATVVATDSLLALPPSQQLLALAQVTLSLTSAGYDAVSFVDDTGTQLAVPIPGGRVLDRPVTAEDYAGMRATTT